MTILDKNVEFKKVLMVITKKTIKQEIPLKEGFSYVEFTNDLKDAWCKLHVKTGLFDDMEQARNKLDDMLAYDEKFFKENFLFVVDKMHHLVASAGLWWGNDFKDKRLRLHYVSVDPMAQHNKIAQSMITLLCMKYDMYPFKYPLYLATQSQSYGAIALYSRMGFTPYLGEYKGCSQSENEAAWQFTTKVLREKAGTRTKN